MDNNGQISNNLREADTYVGPYPDEESDNFNFDVLLTREFYDPEKDGRPLIPGQPDPPMKKHQKLLQHYVNPRTLYNDLLIFHDMGTGKTRSSLAIALAMKERADNFRVPNIFVGRIFLMPNGKEATITSLSPLKALMKRTKEIVEIDPSNVAYPGSIQKVFVLSSSKKAGKVFRKELKKMFPSVFNDPDYPGSASKYNKVAMKNYITHIWTYQQLNRYIAKKSKAYFDNSLFIVDEAHNLIPQSDSGSKFEQYNKIKTLFNTLSNRKIVLLTGTPLINDPVDIVPLMQLILPGGSLVWDNVLTANGSLNPEFEKDFVKESKGKISYLKQSQNVVKSEEVGTTEAPFKHFKLTRLTMSAFQTLALRNVKNADDADDAADSDDADDADGNSKDDLDVAGNKKSQASLMVWPGPGDEPLVGAEGFKRCTSSDGTKFTPSFLAKITTDGNLDFAKLKKYSCKYSYLLARLKKAKGPIFAYCRLIVNGGVNTLVLLLMRMGYSRYEGQTTNGKRFLVFTGNNPPSDSTLQTFNSEENKDGKLCKLIIGSRAASEVYTFKSLVEEIVVTPFWNNLEIQQALARGIRLDSHPYTPDRTVKIVKLAAVPRDNSPSHDLRIYKIAEDRDVSNKKLEDLIKRNAFDCQFNKEWNVRDGTYDKSRACDYRSCDYECEVQKQIDEENFDVDDPQYSDSLPTCSGDDPCIESASWNLYYSPNLEVPIVKYIGKKNDLVEFSLRELYLDALKTNPHLTVTSVIQTLARLQSSRKIVGCRWGRDCYINTIGETIYLTFDVATTTSPMDILANKFYVSNPAFRPALQYRIKDQVGQFSRGSSELENALANNTLLEKKSETRREWKQCYNIAFFKMKTQELLLENSLKYLEGDQLEEMKQIQAAALKTHYKTVLLTVGATTISVLDYVFGGKQVGELGVVPPEGNGTMRISKDGIAWTDATPAMVLEVNAKMKAVEDKLKNDGRTWMKQSFLPPCQACIVPPPKYNALFRKMRSKKSSAKAKKGDARFDLVGKLCSSFTKNEIIVMILDELDALRQENSSFHQRAIDMMPTSNSKRPLSGRDQKTYESLVDIISSSREAWGNADNVESRVLNLIRMNKAASCNILTNLLNASKRIVPDKYCGMAPKKRTTKK